MISSIKPTCRIPFKRNSLATSKNIERQTSPVQKYTDCFLKHSAESVPALFAMTLLWSHLDKASGKMSFKQAFHNNMKSFFAPVLIASSILLSYIDNKNTKSR